MADHYALQVRTGSELRVASALGDETIVPVTYVARRISRRNPRREWRQTAKMSGYVIARVRDWPSTLATDGVYRPVMRGGYPEPIGPSEASRVAAMSDPEPQAEPDARPVYRRGMAVRVLLDQWRDRTAIIVHVSNRGLVLALDQWRVVVGVEDVEAV